MEIQQWPIGRAKPYPNNPRINKTAIIKVADSIRQFGFRQPIIVDKDGVIITGHTRQAAARLLKLKTIPVIVWADATTEQAAKYRLVDNRSSEFATWDLDKLTKEIAAFPSAADLGVWFDIDALLKPPSVVTAHERTRTKNVQAELPQVEPPVCVCPACGHKF